MTKTRSETTVVASSETGDAQSILGSALRLAAQINSASSASLVRADGGGDVTGGAPLGVDDLHLVLPGARPSELGMLDRTANLVRQAWVWSTVATGGQSAGGRLRRANFRGWLGEKLKRVIEQSDSLALLIVEVERDELAAMYGGDDAEEKVPVLYNAVERAVRGVDSVYRCDDASLAVALPRCNRANAAKVAERIELGLREAATDLRRGRPLRAAIRTYAYPGELASFATAAQERDIVAGDEPSLIQLWSSFLAGALDGQVTLLGADRGDGMRPLFALGADPPAKVTAAVEEVIQLGRARTLGSGGSSEKAGLCAPLCQGNRRVGALLIETARPVTAADLELSQAVANHLAPWVERVATPEGAGPMVLGRQTRGYRFKYDDIIGDAPAMRDLFDLLERVIGTDYPVIIQGESGTGKELIARAIHFNGSRADKPLIAENCAALSDNLLEAELFGYEKGAFTGAETSRKGLFELADGGTLFLDEVADMKPSMQKDLLRILQEGIVRPVGGKQFRRVDVRIICASNNDLAALVESGEFRSDLYYRLNVWNLRLPPLRQRVEDLPALVEHCLSKIAKQTSTARKQLGPGVLDALCKHDWPGNIRELKNEIARMVAMSTGDELQIRDFTKRASESKGGAVGAADDDGIVSLADLEKRHILRTLRHTNGNRAQAAELLGINKATIYRKLKQYGLE